MWLTRNLAEIRSKPKRRPEQLSRVTPNTARLAATACLVAPFLGLLWLPWWAKFGPDMAGIPAFYWYPLLWVPLSSLLMAVAAVLLHRNGGSRPDS
jgi:hypothetical protein